MKSVILFLAFSLLLLSPNVTYASSQSIKMTSSGFVPNQLETQTGTEVIFENTDTTGHWPASNVHPTHELYPEFDPQKPIAASESWSFTFAKEGTWQFHDHLYPQTTGTIKVGQTASVTTTITVQQRIAKIYQSTIAKLVYYIKNIKHSPEKKGLSAEFKQPPQADSQKLYSQIDFNCQASDFTCISSLLKEITQKNGPQAAIDILGMLQTNQKISKGIDDHQLAHEFGRQTAKSYGYSAQSFLLCPMSLYNGGCQHGFFETALGQTQSTQEAVDLVCGSLNNTFSSKFRFYCYHGVGHGVMMAQAYNLHASLSICDSLEDSSGQQGCWQGVFMENVNGGLKDQARDGVFSDTDTLAPCNKMDGKYQHECFINHSAWLMKASANNITKAAKICLDAPQSQISTCSQSLGLLTTNPSWQQSIVGASDQPDQVKIALELCYQFPKDSQKDCFIGAVDNIANNDEIVNLEKRALKFCRQVQGWTKNQCYKQIGINITRQIVSPGEKEELCVKIEEVYQPDCRQGAQI